MNFSRVTAVLLALVLVLPAGMLPAYAGSGASVEVSERVSVVDSPSPAVMAVDVLLVRPLGLVATVLGAGIFVVSLPFSAIGGNVGEAGQALVVDPARMTFIRPLGHFND